MGNGLPPFFVTFLRRRSPAGREIALRHEGNTMKKVDTDGLRHRARLFGILMLLGLVIGVPGAGSAQGQEDRAISQAQQAVRERIASREGGRDPRIQFNNDAVVESRSRVDVLVRGTGTFTRNNNVRNANRNVNVRNNDWGGRDFAYEAIVSNRNRNRNGTVSSVKYDWRGEWSDYGGGNDRRGNNERGDNNRYEDMVRPNGRVSYSGPIMNRRSDKALDVTNQGLRDGANIQQWSYADQPNQNWDIIDLGNNEVAIISRHSGRAITVQGGRDNNGANIIQRSWSDTRQQRWRLEQTGGDYYRIVSVDNGKCLDVTDQGKENGSNVQLWSYANQSNQQWRFKR
jgi:hypothetical protein